MVGNNRLSVSKHWPAALPSCREHKFGGGGGGGGGSPTCSGICLLSVAKQVLVGLRWVCQWWGEGDLPSGSHLLLSLLSFLRGVGVLYFRMLPGVWECAHDLLLPN